MSDEKFVFAGNRFFVLEEMLGRRLDVVRILAVRDSYLERVLRDRQIAFSVIESKQHLVSVLASTSFDYFVANGCPFILPISELQDGRKQFVNVHPAPLPDLRGADPVPGALLLNRDSGATCHIMDDGIDTGPIVSRVVIPNTDELDAGLLYQLSFMAEKEVFRAALERSFCPQIANEASADCVYYTKKPEDLAMSFAEPTSAILQRIKAFSNKSQGARFVFREETFRVFDGSRVANPYLLDRKGAYRQNEVVFRYEDCLLIRHDEEFLLLKAIEGDLSVIGVGDILGENGTN